MHKKRPLLVRSAEWVADFLPQIVTTAGGITLAFQQVMLANGSVAVTNVSGILFWSGAACLTAGTVAGVVKKKRVSTLSGQVDSLNTHSEQLETIVRDLVTFYLRDLAVSLELGSNERVSVYHHNGTAFELFGRYSSNPLFAKLGRPEYPDCEGCIGKAWAEDDVYVGDLPDPTSHSKQYLGRLQKDWRIPESTARDLTMKSRTYAAFSFCDLADTKKVGVIVLESTKADGINRDLANRIVRHDQEKRISQILEITQYRKTAVSYAKAEGF